MAEKIKRPGRVKHGEALAHYLAMGADRSLKKLRAQYCDKMVHPPALVTVEKWSARFDWVAQAKDHDERVAAQLGERAEEAAVEEGWDTVTALTDLARKALDTAIAGFDDGKLTADDAYQIQALLNSTVTALKHIELISGRATGRLDTIDAKAHAPEWLQNMLTAPAPAPSPTAASLDDEADTPATRH